MENVKSPKHWKGETPKILEKVKSPKHWKRWNSQNIGKGEIPKTLEKVKSPKYWKGWNPSAECRIVGFDANRPDFRICRPPVISLGFFRGKILVFMIIIILIISRFRSNSTTCWSGRSNSPLLLLSERKVHVNYWWVEIFRCKCKVSWPTFWKVNQRLEFSILFQLALMCRSQLVYICISFFFIFLFVFVSLFIFSCPLHSFK